MSAPSIGGYRPWTPEEDQALRDHYLEHGATWDGWGKLGVERSVSAIMAHARVLGIVPSTATPRPYVFSSFDDFKLVAAASTIAKHLGVTPGAAAYRMYELTKQDFYPKEESR